MLAALGCVTHVVAFADETPHALLRSLKPHVLVKGGTYTTEEVVGREGAPNSLQKRGLPIAVLPGGAIHFGLGGSTWTEDSGRRPELTEEQLQEHIKASLIH